jgi:hypothetical protein
MQKSFVSKTWGVVHIEEGNYTDSGRLALILRDTEEARLATLTVNLPDCKLEPGEFFVKNWSENQELAAEAMASGLFIDTGKRAQSGFVQPPIWKFKERVLTTNEIEDTFTEVLKSEYGGHDPRLPGPIFLNARIKEKVIEIFIVGKWRPVRHYPYNKIPSAKILNEVREKLVTNTGGEKSFLKNRSIVFKWKGVGL